MQLDKNLLKEMYRRMARIRHFEEKIHELNEEGRLKFVQSGVHLYLGEEAVAVGACANLRKEDYITSTHRGHGHCIAKGARLDKMMSELFGKETGYCKGKGGSMHIADFDIGILGANGIVGAGIPQAVGAGLSIKMKGLDRVCVCFFGDSASNTGAFHEGLNLAAVWKLPVVFVCENNLYGITVPSAISTSVQNIADRAASYNIPGVTVDGQDVIAVYNSVREAIKRAKSGLGPTLIECKTYRFCGHFEGDPWDKKAKGGYRSKDEVARWKDKDPLKTFPEKLIKEKVLTPDELQEIEHEIHIEVDSAVKFADESPYPALETATKGVLYE